MGVSLYYNYYHNKCIDKDIMPYLEICDEFNYLNGKHLESEFYDNCRELAIHEDKFDCYVFTDSTKLFIFASRFATPVKLSDYITENYREELVFIIWVR